jgi:hypothetical protein
MAAGSAYADSILAGNQADHLSYMHAMTSNDIPNKREACELMNAFVKKNMEAYRKGVSNAYFRLGVAMHAVMDSTAPPHRGFKYWEKSQTRYHGPDKFIINRPKTQEGLKALIANPALVRETIELMNKVMSGEYIDCRCYYGM